MSIEVSKRAWSRDGGVRCADHRVGLRIGASPVAVRRGRVAVVAAGEPAGEAATSQLLVLLAERRLKVSLVLEVEPPDGEVGEVVRRAATDPRVDVVLVHSRVACGQAVEAVLGELDGARAPVAVMDGSGRGGAHTLARGE